MKRGLFRYAMGSNPIPVKTIALTVIIAVVLVSAPCVHSFSNTGRTLSTQQLRLDKVPGRFSFQLSHQKYDLRQQRRKDIFKLGTASVATTYNTDDNLGYDPLESANKIHPRTKRLRKSFTFYVSYVLREWGRIHRENKLHRLEGNIKALKAKKKAERKAMWTKLNEQRKNVVELADYKAGIVVPSFLFAFLGALMASITPSYYAKCVHCVSTLTDSPRQLMAAVIGLGISCTLEALFTGLRGSLFWIAGK